MKLKNFIISLQKEQEVQNSGSFLKEFQKFLHFNKVKSINMDYLHLNFERIPKFERNLNIKI